MCALFCLFVLASRPLLDSSGRAVLLCHTPKREYLRKLMHEPLPIESHLDHVMAEHMNAEVCHARMDGAGCPNTTNTVGK